MSETGRREAKAGRMPALAPIAALLAALALASGCEQFARVGTLDAGEGDAVGPDPGDGGLPAPDAGRDPSNDPTCAREYLVCDPILNMGCPAALGMQCAVDIAAPRLAGYCTFLAPLPESPVNCLNTGVTESCPPTTACLLDECRKLCVCNAQCPAGECCTGFLTESGFKVCEPCS